MAKMMPAPVRKVVFNASSKFGETKTGPSFKLKTNHILKNNANAITGINPIVLGCLYRSKISTSSAIALQEILEPG